MKKKEMEEIILMISYMVKKFHNDADLGGEVRKYINFINNRITDE